MIKASRVIDGVRPQAIENGVIVVRGGKIEAVGSASQIQIPAGAIVVDLPGHTLLPGLIDSHVHPTTRGNEGGLQATRDAHEEHDGKQMVRAVRNMRVTLLAGITTVRSVGESRGNDTVLANAIRDGVVPGPRIIPSGPQIVSTGDGVPLWAVDGPENVTRCSPGSTPACPFAGRAGRCWSASGKWRGTSSA